jgi:hypothetical protein
MSFPFLCDVFLCVVRARAAEQRPTAEWAALNIAAQVVKLADQDVAAWTAAGPGVPFPFVRGAVDLTALEPAASEVSVDAAVYLQRVLAAEFALGAAWIWRRSGGVSHVTALLPSA